MSKTKPTTAKLPDFSLKFRKTANELKVDNTKLATENTYNWDDFGFAGKRNTKISWQSIASNLSVDFWKSMQGKG